MSGNNALDILLRDLQDPFASQVQSNSIYIALALSLGVSVLIGLVFCLIRPYHNAVYAPKLKHADKRHAPPPMGRGIFGWIDPIVKTKEAEFVDKVGMDGAVFLRFVKMLRMIFIALTIVGCGILIPVHIAFSQDNIVQAHSKRQDYEAAGVQDSDNSTAILYKLTPKTVKSEAMWAHVVFAWLADLIIMFFLWYNYKAIVQLRKRWFESPEYQNSVHGRSLMVRDISKQNRSDQGVLKIVDSVTQVASIPKTAIARNMKELPELLEEHETTVRKLESVLAKYLKNPDSLPPNRPLMRVRGRGKVDAIDYLTNRIQELEIRVRDTRDSIDRRNPEPYGFAAYDSIFDAHTVAWQARKKRPMGSTVTLSPSPKDIIWKNMRLSKTARSRKRFMANVWVAILTTLYIAPNAFVAIFLADLSKLAAIWPAFARAFFNPQNSFWFGVLQAVLAPALFSLFYLLLPSIFRRISENAGDHTKTSRERHVTHKLYAFFVFNNLIIFSIFSALWNLGSALITAAQNSKDVGVELKAQLHALPVILLATVCNVSPFWVVWLLQRNIGALVDLAQLWNMFLQWFNRTFFAPTPRERIELTAPPPFDYASYYNYFLYYATVATVFAPIQPIVLPVVLLYFVIDCWLKKYLLLYVFITKTESGGQFWNVLHNRMLFSCLLQNLVGALVIKGAGGPWLMLYVMAPLPFILLGFKIWIAKTYANQARFYVRELQANAADAEALTEVTKKIKSVSSRLLNPVMTKPLITPMVHAKAQHVLVDIYKGRMDDAGDGETTRGYGDIPMTDMGQKRQGDLADMFEVVQENQLDFAHFKDRAEFRDQFGGSGELYGHGIDAMTERSATPASFMTSDTASDDGLTRYGTPEPMPNSTHPAFRNSQHRGPYGVNPVQGYDFSSHEQHGTDARSALGGARPAFYRNENSTDSARHLVGSAQPMGYSSGESPMATPAGITPGDEYSESQMYNMDRWRTGGSGYNPVNSNTGDSGYDSFRRGGRY